MSVTSAPPSVQAGPAGLGQLNAIGRCQICGNMRHTKAVTYYRNVGMLVMRRTYTVKGELCRPCIHKYFWEFAWKNLLMGPWGMISLIMMPIYLIQNACQYLVALYKLRDIPE